MWRPFQSFLCWFGRHDWVAGKVKGSGFWCKRPYCASTQVNGKTNYRRQPRGYRPPSK